MGVQGNVENFSEEQRKRITCSICLEIYEEPVEVACCRHVFCKVSFNNLKKNIFLELHSQRFCSKPSKQLSDLPRKAGCQKTDESSSFHFGALVHRSNVLSFPNLRRQGRKSMALNRCRIWFLNFATPRPWCGISLYNANRCEFKFSFSRCWEKKTAHNS